MAVAIDESRCPSCGHETLTWGATCPGCNEIPWATSAGQRVEAALRLKRALWAYGPAILGIGLVGGIATFTAYSNVREAGESRIGSIRRRWTVPKGLFAAVEEFRPLQTAWTAAEGKPSNEVRASFETWKDRHWSSIMAAASAESATRSDRHASAFLLVAVVRSPTMNATLTPAQWADAQKVLKPLRESGDEKLRAMAAMVQGLYPVDSQDVKALPSPWSK